ncbi:MAG TPA: acyl-CoA dehydrogenase family protein, partial [Kofleriaceae bacterium]|nr:acyl-CoA dehydrogenase family protein [Kofleriaceae bacterium]
MAYAALDYYGIDELFTHEERLVRDTVRELVTSRVMPTIGQHWAAGTFPTELPAELGKLGLLGSSLHGYGCAGITPSAYGLVCQ